MNKDEIINKEEFRTCTNCQIHHYENCTKCFGFGLDAATKTPISSGEAMGDDRLPNWIECFVCKSTPKGVPVK